MKPAFLLDENGGLISALVPANSPQVIKNGMHVKLSAPLDLQPYGVVSAGAKGWVETVNADDGTVEVLMEGLEPALHEWRNILVLRPFQTDDAIMDITVSRYKRPKKPHNAISWRTYVPGVAVSFIGWLVWDFFFQPPLYKIDFGLPSMAALFIGYCVAILSTYVSLSALKRKNDT